MINPELFGNREELVDNTTVNLFRFLNFQFTERMSFVVAAQIGKATAVRFDDEVIVFTRRLVVSV